MDQVLVPSQMTAPEPASSLSKSSVKRKTITLSSGSSEEKTHLGIISDRLVDRNIFKDEADSKLNTKKLKILDIEEKIKNMQLMKLEMEMQHLKAKQALELQILEVELNIKKADLERKKLNL